MNEDLKWSNYDFSKIPFDDIVSVGQRTLLYRDLFTVSWLLGRFCNYKCSYCWPYARSDRKDHRPTDLCLKTIDSIKEQARGNGFNSFHFSLSGGEPTFHPGYLDILNHLANDVRNTNYTSVHMTSNCSRNMRWFEDYVEKVKPFHRASITASLHTEHVNSKEKMQDFADKLIFCQEHDVQEDGAPQLAQVIIDAVARLIPGVLGDSLSAVDDSFSGTDRLIEGPQYTRPREFRGLQVPDILLSGDHQRIADWRKTQAVNATQKQTHYCQDN